MINKIIIKKVDWIKICFIFKTIKKEIWDYLEGMDELENKNYQLTIKKKSFIEILKINKINYTNYTLK